MMEWQQLIMAVFYQIPEGLLMMYVGLSLVSTVPTAHQRRGGLVYGLSIPLVRHFIGIGPHIFFLISIYILIAHYVAKASWMAAFSAAVLGFSLIFLGDMVLLYPALILLGISLEDVLNSVGINVLIGWISAIPLVITAMAVKILNLRFFSF